MTKGFTIRFDGDAYLTVDEIWPDGDAPENPTEHDVAEVLKRYSLGDLIDDWAIGPDVFVGSVHLTSSGLRDKLKEVK